MILGLTTNQNNNFIFIISAMEKVHNIGVLQVSLLDNNPKSYSGLVEALQNDVSILHIEARHGSRISSELDSKMEWFNKISSTLLGKLESLRCLANLRCQENNEPKEFAEKISASWTLAIRQVCEEYARIRVASRTLSGIPLTTLLQKIRKQATAAKKSLAMGKNLHNRSYIVKGLSIIDEITTLIKDLEKSDEKVQQYLAICKMTPYLVELDSTVDGFVRTNELLPARGRNSTELRVFQILGCLLTEELLGRDPIDLNHVLVSNAPRKPVFITKNVAKRKMDIPALPAPKMPKNSSYLSSFH